MKQHVPLPEEHVASVMRVSSLSNVANIGNAGSVELGEQHPKPTPSGEMGLPAEKENEWKRLAIHFIICVGQKLHMYVAILICTGEEAFVFFCCLMFLLYICVRNLS